MTDSAGDELGAAMESKESMIPLFRDDGYLPEGLHLASEAEITFRFGASTQQRR